jgi:hypothetical protein
MFDHFYNDIRNLLLWVLFGLLAAVAKIQRDTAGTGTRA